MNGATALDCENAISRPNSTNTITIGISQYFFSCFRNCQNSVSTRLFAMPYLSEHPLEVIRIAKPFRRRRPAGPVLAAQGQRVVVDQAPQDAHRDQDDREGDRQDDAGVD